MKSLLQIAGAVALGFSLVNCSPAGFDANDSSSESSSIDKANYPADVSKDPVSPQRPLKEGSCTLEIGSNPLISPNDQNYVANYPAAGSSIVASLKFYGGVSDIIHGAMSVNWSRQGSSEEYGATVTVRRVPEGFIAFNARRTAVVYIYTMQIPAGTDYSQVQSVKAKMSVHFGQNLAYNNGTISGTAITDEVMGWAKCNLSLN